MKKKILTLNDLYCFFDQKNQTTVFNAKESGFNIAVQVPARFELEDDDEDDGFLRTKFKVNHLYENRNKSYISEEAQLEALPSLHYRPVLAAITTLSDGTTDFTSHAMEFDEEGNVIYIEQPIGVFVNPENYHLEYDESHDKTYVIADAVIYNDYCAPACEIIKRKRGTKVSCELSISELSFDVKDKVLHLDKFRYNGVTCLGTDPVTEKPVEEGMEGARLDISDFSEDKNSLFTNTEEKLLKVIQSLQDTLAKFEIKEPTKGGDQTLKLNELLEKYSKTVEDLDFDYESLSDEELEAKFAELFENEPEILPEPETPADFNKKKYIQKENGNTEVAFEISHEDVRGALYSLLSTWEENDDEWYYINATYDDYFVYSNWDESKIFRHGYMKDGDSVSLADERTELFKEYLTLSEKTELENLRSNYAALQAKVNDYESKDKAAVLDAEIYGELKDREDFKELINNQANYSVEEVQTKADAILGKYVKEKGTFNYQQKPSAIGFTEPKKAKKPYGSLFKD